MVTVDASSLTPPDLGADDFGEAPNPGDMANQPPIDMANRPPVDMANRPVDLGGGGGPTNPPPGFISDYSSRPQQAVALPAKNGSYIDPVFGSKVIRVTDASDGSSCSHAYNYWPAFNANSTRLLIACNDSARTYTFRPESDTFTYDGPVGGSGVSIQYEGAYWSHSDPNVLYAISGMKLYRIDVSKSDASRYTLVRDFAGAIASGYTIHQLGMADDDNQFTFTTRAGNGGVDTYAYRRDTNQLTLFPRSGGFLSDESQIAKSGQWVVIVGQTDDEWRVWNFVTGEIQILTDTAANRPGGHYDVGRKLVNTDRYETGLLIRDYAGGLRSFRNIMHYYRSDGRTANWGISDHVSNRTDAEKFVIASTYGGSGSWQPFEKEIILVFTNGSGFVRLAHTRETRAGQTYVAEPRAVVDRSGRYVVWTSDLGSSRLDVMMLKIPAALVP